MTTTPTKAENPSEEVAEVLADHAWWNELATSLGGRVLGFTYRHAATFVWPDQSTSEISGGLLKALLAQRSKP